MMSIIESLKRWFLHYMPRPSLPGGFEASIMDQASIKKSLQTTEINLISNRLEHTGASLKLSRMDRRKLRS